MNTPKTYFIKCDDDSSYYRTVAVTFNVMTRKMDVHISRDANYGEPSDSSIKEISKKQLMMLQKGKAKSFQ